MSIKPLSNLQLERANAEPLWSQLANGIRDIIRSGGLKDDESLPSESELISYFNVSRTVIREALSDLVSSGTIYKLKGKGSFVAPTPQAVQFLGSLSGSADDIRKTGKSMTTAVLHQSLVEATSNQAEMLDISAGDPVVRFLRLRRVEGVPWLLVETFVPAKRFPGIERVNLENGSLYDLIRRQYDTAPIRAERWFQAVLPTQEEASLLETTVHTPLLRIQSRAFDKQEKPIEYYEALHRSDEFKFYVGVRRG